MMTIRGTVRSAHTLSGRGKFYSGVSFGTFFSRSDSRTSEGGVLIDALFIDEGFGSLDEEALEMAMEALETIENEGQHDWDY